MPLPANDTAAQLIQEIAALLPRYVAEPADWAIGEGNVAVCVLTSSGAVTGQIFGENRARGRQAFRIAWLKASQVWLTGMKTGEFERAVFNGQLAESDFGLQRPEFIGWEGGQPFALPNGESLAVGVSGMRGVIDLEIAVQAAARLGLRA